MITRLLQSLPLPSCPIQSYADARDTQKIGALEATGFRQTAVLASQFKERDVWRDVWLYSRA